MAIRTPFESWDQDAHWEEILEDQPADSRDVAELRLNPLRLLKSADIMKTRYKVV